MNDVICAVALSCWNEIIPLYWEAIYVSVRSPAPNFWPSFFSLSFHFISFYLHPMMFGVVLMVHRTHFVRLVKQITVILINCFEHSFILKKMTPIYFRNGSIEFCFLIRSFVWGLFYFNSILNAMHLYTYRRDIITIQSPMTQLIAFHAFLNCE